jgi:hypothetical protein
MIPRRPAFPNTNPATPQAGGVRFAWGHGGVKMVPWPPSTGTELKNYEKKHEILHILPKKPESAKAFFTFAPITRICGETECSSLAPRITSPPGQTDRK